MVSPSLTFGPLPGGRSKYGDLAIRTAGSLWFFLLAALVVFAVINDLAIGDRPVVWTEVVSHSGLLLFYLTLWLMVLIRPAPIRTSHPVAPRVRGAPPRRGSRIDWSRRDRSLRPALRPA